MGTTTTATAIQPTNGNQGGQGQGAWALSAELQERVFVAGDLSKLSPGERNTYYVNLCSSLGLNPLTRPFEYLTLQGRMILYARKDATEQLRARYGISIYKLEKEISSGVLTVTAYARTPDGREDIDEGAVSLGSLQGDALANARLKAVTKAKRRVTLSICGLGFLDETEVESIPGARIVTEAASGGHPHAQEDIPFNTGGNGDKPVRVTVDGEIVEPGQAAPSAPERIVPYGAASHSNDIIEERRLKAAEEIKSAIRRTGSSKAKRDQVFQLAVGTTDVKSLAITDLERLGRVWAKFQTIDDVDAYIDRETNPTSATPIFDPETGEEAPF